MVADALVLQCSRQAGVIEETSTYEEYAEQTAVFGRSLYAAPNRLTSHRLIRLDLPAPDSMRAPGEVLGMLAYEAAFDELAHALRMDPIELRILNEPKVDPESGLPFSTRNLVACLREGARRFGWQDRPKQPASRRDGDSLIGYGVSARSRPSICASVTDAEWFSGVPDDRPIPGARSVFTRPHLPPRSHVDQGYIAIRRK